jgi:Uma2 family endonuclease
VEVNLMSLPQSQPLYTVEEYLALEREAEERHEYLDGFIYAMAGESPNHGAICVNLTRIISTQLLGTPCQMFSKDMKVRSGPIPKTRYTTKGLFSYPDLLVVCGELQFHDKHQDVLLNPTVIIEVLSPSTEAFDRGQKFRRYRMHIPTLTDYIVVSQDRSLIEHFARQDNGQWAIAASVEELSESLSITSIGCALRLSDVYDRVTFPPEPPDPDEEPSSEVTSDE